MKITDILAKAAKGEALTDEEKEFAGRYSPQGDIDAAAKAARKKAEAERDDLKTKLEEANSKLEDAEGKAGGNNDAIAKLTKKLEAMEAKSKAAEEALAAKTRTDNLRGIAAKNGIKAAKGIATESLDILFGNAFKDVDLDDEDAVKAAVESFKSANGGMIDAGTIGGAGAKGRPGGQFNGPNPFSKKTFNLTKQIELKVSNPEMAASLESAAAEEG